MNKEILGIGYIRVSSKRQTFGVSLDTQEESLIRLFKQNGCTKWRIYRDKGISGRDIIKRDEFIEALEDAAVSKADFFGTHETSRFARNTIQSIGYFSDLVKQGTIFLCSTARFDDTPESKLMYSILATFDEFFSNKLSIKIKDNLATLKKRGLKLGPANSGYLNVRENKKAWVIPHPTQSEPLKKALKKFASYQLLSQIQMVEYLTINGFVRPRNKLGVTKQFVSDILRNPFYCGYNKFENGKLLEPHPYEPLITPDEFLANQTRLDPNLSNKQHRRVRDDLPLKQLLICETCGRRMIGYTHSNGEGWSFCRYACKTKGCTKSILSNDMHLMFKQELESLEADDGSLNLLSDIFVKLYKKNENNYVKERLSLEKQLKNLTQELEQNIETITKLTQLSVINRFEQKVISLESEIKRVTSELENYNEPENYERLINESIEYLRSPLQNWSSYDPYMKINYQNWLFPKGIFYTQEKTLRTPIKCQTYSLLGKSGSKSRSKYAREDSNLRPTA